MSDAKNSPLPWFVRKWERDGELIDCFVAAKNVNGFAYDAEILGDDEYREGAIERKLADCELIVTAVNAHADLLAALEEIKSIINKQDGCDWDEIEEAREIARAAIAKSKPAK